MGSPAGGDQDRGPKLVAIYWVESAVAIIVFALRVWGRVMIRQLGPDDFVMLLTLLIFLVLAGFITHLAQIGGCRHLFYLTAAEQTEAIKWNWISQPWVIMGFAIGKASVALLLMRIIVPSSVYRRWTLYGTMVTVVLINAIDIILTFVQCDPPEALWDTHLVQDGEATCWDPSVQKNFAVFTSGWNIAVDVILALLPITVVWKLKFGVRWKIGLCLLLGLGLAAAVCGAVKTKYLISLTARSDLSWETYNLFAWSGAELFVIIVCGSIPPIKPLYERVFHHKHPNHSIYRQQYDYGGSTYHRSRGTTHDSIQSTKLHSRRDGSSATGRGMGQMLEDKELEELGISNEAGITKITEIDVHVSPNDNGSSITTVRNGTREV